MRDSEGAREIEETSQIPDMSIAVHFAKVCTEFLPNFAQIPEISRWVHVPSSTLRKYRRSERSRQPLTDPEVMPATMNR